MLRFNDCLFRLGGPWRRPPNGIRGRLLDKAMQRQFKIIVEKHADGYVAYPLGLKGVVVGDGNTYDEAVADVKSAIQFHIETFGTEVLPGDSTVLDAFIAEATIPA
jgi:predicted RNase H-like HicB family nuclease